MTKKNDPIHIEEVENGFLVECWVEGPNPRTKITHIFESMGDLLQHVFNHFDYEGRVLIQTLTKGEE